MDATKRPLAIPPEISTYAEKHGLFDLYKNLLTELVIHKPEDPLDFIIDFLKRDENDVPRIVILGPPASGKGSIAGMLCEKLGAVRVTMNSVISGADKSLAAEAQQYLAKSAPLPAELWAKIVHNRLNMFDAVKKGWVIDCILESREQLLALSALGSFPKHCVLLDAPDQMLIERAAGKRIDPETGNIYHVTFDMPMSSQVASRLVEPAGYGVNDMVEKLAVYHRNINGIQTCFKHILKTINADQPKADVFMQALTFVTQPARSAAPRTPRVLLIGPRGSGKATQANLLATKYRLVSVSCGQLVREAVAGQTSTGHACKAYVDRGQPVPDAIILQLVKNRLSQLDCVTRGWVLYGYPRSRDQAENLAGAGYSPNRVFFLDISYEAILERLTLRGTDPSSGQQYHLLTNPPRTQEIKDRLATHPRDREEQVIAGLSEYQAIRDDLTEFYAAESGALHVNADQDRHTIFETLESMIVNPLPKRPRANASA